MQITISNARYVMNQCVKSIRQSRSYLNQVASTLQISKTPRRSEQDLYQRYLTEAVHFSARSPQGFRASLKGVACSVAVVIGISLSIAEASSSEASIVPLKVLANKQLTNKQYSCHNQIVHKESTWKIDAVGNKSGTKQTHGYYQIKSDYIKGKPYDYQFWMYWHYVSKRYGITKYDEPDYCKALHHLKTKGWQ